MISTRNTQLDIEIDTNNLVRHALNVVFARI